MECTSFVFNHLAAPVPYLGATQAAEIVCQATIPDSGPQIRAAPHGSGEIQICSSDIEAEIYAKLGWSRK
jgi:hypothetical protein